MLLPILFLAALFGLLFGSFANVVILRDDRRASIVAGRSECPKCHHLLRPWELVPVLSWLALRGRCSKCKESISVQYPLVELSAALLLAGAAWYGYELHNSPIGAVLLGISLLLALIVSVIDILSMEVPIDYVVASGIFAAASSHVIGTTSWMQSLEGLAVGAGSLAAVIVLWKLIRHEEGMGSGDIWIAGAIGAGLGPLMTYVALFMAVWAGSIVGIIYGIVSRKGLKLRMPFGPFLYAGGIVALLFGQRIVDWYILNLR